MNSPALFILFALQATRFVEGSSLDAFVLFGVGYCFDGSSDYTATTGSAEDCAKECFEYRDCLVFQWKLVDQICLMSKTPIDEEHVPYECTDRDLYKRKAFVVWGGFNSDSLIGVAEALTYYGGNLDSLRTLISKKGGTITELTQTLTEEYLSQIDIFYTSRIARGLSIAEQSALRDWVLDGGTLVVTVYTVTSTPSSPWYASFTEMFGMITTGLPVFYNSVTLSVPDSSIHPLLNGVGSMYDYGVSAFTVEDYVDILVEHSGLPLVAVLEDVGPGCGAVLVTGWYSIHDGYLKHEDNLRYLDNLVEWAHGFVKTNFAKILANNNTVAPAWRC